MAPVNRCAAPFGLKSTTSDHLRTPESGLPDNARIGQAQVSEDETNRGIAQLITFAVSCVTLVVFIGIFIGGALSIWKVE